MAVTSTPKHRSTKAEHEKKRAEREEKRRNDPYAMPKWYAYQSWVVPTRLLADFMHDHKHHWQAQYSPPPNSGSNSHAMSAGVVDDAGWKTYLTYRLSMILGRTEEAIARRLHEYDHATTRTANSEYADAICLTLGLSIDHETTLPVLPGSRGHARDLIELRAMHYGKPWGVNRVEEEMRKTLFLCCQIVNDPYNAAKYMDKAPLDCLRPL